MESELKAYHSYRRLLQLRLVTSGLWPNYEKYPRAVKYLLTFIAGSVSVCLTAGVANFCIKNGNNIPLLSRGMASFVSYLSVVLKVFIISYHQKRLQTLNEGLSANFARDLEVPENRPYLLAHAKSFARMFYAFDYFIASNLTLIITIPLTMVRHGKYVRMYPQILPFTYEPGGTVHWIIYGYEILFSYYLWTVTCGVDSYLGLYALHIVGQIKLLTSRFLNLKAGENYRRDLKDIIDRHSALMEAQHLLEEVFGFLVLWLAVTCAMILCFVIFQATSSSNFSFLKILMIFTWTTLKLIQAFSYAWYGNIIAVENQKCLDAIYFAEWVTKGDLRLMKDMLIVLAQSPLVFQAKGIMWLDFNMFSKIVNTSVSYFFLLQTLEEKAAE